MLRSRVRLLRQIALRSFACLALLGACLAPAPALATDLSTLIAASEITMTTSLHPDGSPRFLRGRWPVPATPTVGSDPGGAAVAFINWHNTAFGLSTPSTQITLVSSQVDGGGVTHVRLARHHTSGTPVLEGSLLLHYSSGGKIIAINGMWSPNLSVSVTPTVTSVNAIAAAQTAFPSGTLDGSASLVIAGGELMWEFILIDNSVPTRRRYFVSAVDGLVFDYFELVRTAKDRDTYDAGNGDTLPGTLERSEGEGVVGDTDVDNAHDFSGETYDYFSTDHGRDSYDDAGATIISSAHYKTDHKNASWNGSQTAYGDNMATKDICAHELTHAVTQHTADLVYSNEQGALNESFSDIFGVMVDDDDWELGEGSALGVIRDLQDPPAHDQPDHMDNYYCGNDDYGGVHINSGIQNHAGYELATNTTRADAAAIFYSSLADCMHECSVHLDARDCALLAAENLYGSPSTELTETENAFTHVGLSKTSTAPTCKKECVPSGGGCLTLEVARANGLALGASYWVGLTADLYRVRDETLQAASTGRDLIDDYYEHGPALTAAVLSSPTLTDDAATLLTQIEPGIAALLGGTGSTVFVTQSDVDLANSVLTDIVTADATLAPVVGYWTGRINLQNLVGLSYDAAADAIVTLQIPTLTEVGWSLLAGALLVVALWMGRRSLRPEH